MPLKVYDRALQRKCRFVFILHLGAPHARAIGTTRPNPLALNSDTTGASTKANHPEQPPERWILRQIEFF